MVSHQPFDRQIFQLKFPSTWSCVSLTRSTTWSEWKLFGFDKIGGNDFQILMIFLIFSKFNELVFYVLSKNEKNMNIIGTGG